MRCFPDGLVQTILLHFGVDDTHPITTSLSCAVVTMTLRSGTALNVVETSFIHE